MGSSPWDREHGMCYIPPQEDPYSTASKRALRESPVRFFLRDAVTLVRLLRYIPWLFLPLRSKDKNSELFPNKRRPWESLLQGFLAIFEVLLLLLSLPAFVVLPGGILLLIFALVVLSIYLLALPLTGPGVSSSNPELIPANTLAEHATECWLFVNGCASGYHTLQRDIDCISCVFGRKVTGIHNKTYGLTADILECLIQRVFDYKTTDTRVAYERIKAVVCDEMVTKVVLIGHSQGGIVISLVLDQLFTELPHSTMSKLEVYTFGSAASHFPNPRVSDSSTASKKLGLPQVEHAIKHIEQ